MTIKIHDLMTQGSAEWYAARTGLLTASEMKLIVTPTLKVASNEKERSHLYELLAQRITGHVEPSYVGDDMLRGMEDEIDAREKYAANYADLTTVGFITNDRWGFTVGYSPDALVGDDGLIEIKSRRQKFQIETLIEHTVPAEHLIQVQTGLLVSERRWCDYVSYSAGLPMVVVRVLPDPDIQAAIIAAATAFETRLAEKLAAFREAMAKRRYIATERRIEQEMYA
ncbi:MAG: YqaJ-like viral recombinase [Phenylobacterium sp.]|nr:YqaJ-like viral recombinase [Phenylobacterium sp.]